MRRLLSFSLLGLSLVVFFFINASQSSASHLDSPSPLLTSGRPSTNFPNDDIWGVVAMGSYNGVQSVTELWYHKQANDDYTITLTVDHLCMADWDGGRNDTGYNIPQLFGIDVAGGAQKTDNYELFDWAKAAKTDIFLASIKKTSEAYELADQLPDTHKFCSGRDQFVNHRLNIEGFNQPGGGSTTLTVSPNAIPDNGECKDLYINGQSEEWCVIYVVTWHKNIDYLNQVGAQENHFKLSVDQSLSDKVALGYFSYIGKIENADLPNQTNFRGTGLVNQGVGIPTHDTLWPPKSHGAPSREQRPAPVCQDGYTVVTPTDTTKSAVHCRKTYEASLTGPPFHRTYTCSSALGGSLDMDTNQCILEHRISSDPSYSTSRQQYWLTHEEEVDAVAILNSTNGYEANVRWSTSIAFAPDCDATDFDNSIGIFDHNGGNDGVIQPDPSIQAKLYYRDRGRPNDPWMESSASDLNDKTKASNKWQYFPESYLFEKDKEYLVTLENIHSTNGIGIRLPWSQINSIGTCVEDDYEAGFIYDPPPQCKIKFWIKDPNHDSSLSPYPLFQLAINSGGTTTVINPPYNPPDYKNARFEYVIEYPDDLKIPPNMPKKVHIFGKPDPNGGWVRIPYPSVNDRLEDYELDPWEECDFKAEVSSDGCSLRGWIQHPFINKDDPNSALRSLTVELRSTTRGRSGFIPLSDFVYGYGNRVKVDISYVEHWKLPQSDANVDFELFIQDINRSGSFKGWISGSRLYSFLPWDSSVDGLADADNGPVGQEDCHIGIQVPDPPAECDVSPIRVRASKGVSMHGDTFPLFAEFYHGVDADNRRLFKFTANVSGPSRLSPPGFSDRVNYLPEKSTKTVFDTRVPSSISPGPNLHTYKWEIDWQYDTARETSRQDDWNDWRDDHRNWILHHRSWENNEPQPHPSGGHDHHSGGHDNWTWNYSGPAYGYGSSPGSFSGSKTISGYTDTSHTHYDGCTREDDVWGNVTRCKPDDPNDCTTTYEVTGTETVKYNCGSSHYNSTLTAWKNAEPKEPTQPGDPNPEGSGGTVYNPGYGSYPSAPENVFDESFPIHPTQHHPNPPPGKLECDSEQLIIIAPVCDYVSGGFAYVGESKSVTSGTFRNPNQSTEANLDAFGIGFTIVGKDYHTSISARGSPNRVNLPANGSTTVNGELTSINLPNTYDQITWYLTWTKDWGDPPSTWPENTDRVPTQPVVSCSVVRKPVKIFADPPTCKVIDWHWEVEPSGTPPPDSLIRIEVELTNPNRVPIAINTAGYTITDIGSGNASNLISPPLPRNSPHNPIHSAGSPATYPTNSPPYIPNGGTVTLISQKHPYHEPGQYNYSWSIDSFLGIERWNTSPSRSRAPATHPLQSIKTIANGGCGEILRLAYLPYIKVYEGDVAVGGRFGTGSSIDACNSGNSIIGTKYGSVAEGRTYGFSKHTGTSSIGASVEYALRAFSSVYGYYSASQRTGGTPSPHTGLTLANTPSNPGTPHGGDYGHGATNSFANRRCIANYWAVITNGQQTDTIVSGSLDGGSLDLADDSLVPENSRVYHNGNLNITASSQLEINSAIYVEGDIFINSDIVNNHVKAWQQDRRKVGSLYLIAKGNVYISRDVGQIDAIIIAIPPGNNPADKGIVYTCSGGGTSRTTHLGATNHHRLCSKQLTVNGAVIARSIVLGRTHGSRNLGSAFEHPDGSPNASNVAEIFYFSPEYYVSLPIASSAESQIDRDKYYRSDSIISLPPLF